MTKDGLAVCRQLTQVDGVRCNVTLIFCALQAVFWRQGRATYVSPFVGRLDDQSVAGLEVVRSISELYRIHGMRTQVLSAQSVVSNEPSGPGTMVQRSVRCLPRSLNRCMITS